ncbi:phosphocholine-specific phospholipase C [Pedobacter gandavensis]|uniref:phosphocholine-specific phospholipase C n=1 Tax=Pedobacter gandavensis TaxID=2679963 RepID=UPI0029301BBE|nr:phospholipase C, phosphocholine-specific [Pedobacter gandavensis]
MESRRDFIKKATLLTGALGMAGMLPTAIQRAMAINPAIGSSYLDAAHVVFLMQENRSFDHAFGTLKGVRGFNNPRAITLPNQYPVWLQSNKKGETYAPFRLNIKDTKATWMSALPHSWENQVDARNNGNYDGWLEAKKSGNKEYADMPLTMGYYNREDIPFYYSLADAFTVCDHNFCSILTGTSPNRCFFWTGKIREEQNATSTAHHSNGYIDGSERLSWSTFPERLSKHGVDWKIYQNELSVGVDLEDEEESWLANFTDNDMEFFKQYHVKRHPEHLVYLRKTKSQLEDKLKEKADAKLQKKLDFVSKEIEFLELNPLEKLSPEQQELHKRAFVTNRNDPDFHSLESHTYNDNGTERTAKIPKGDVLYQFRKDVDNGQLPTVSWLVAPCNFSDHPGAPWYGAWYLSEAIDILTKNPEVWKKTIFILTYDENDGYFDHLPPFVAPNPTDPSTGKISKSLDSSAEYIYKGKNSDRESAVGLGFRVPMVVVSPWSRGGYVNSQTFDHTSSIQFLEHFLSHKTGQKIHEDNISSWRRSLCGDLSSVFRPYNGENIPVPKTVERVPFLEGIHKAKFAKLPDGYKNLDKAAIAGILKNPKNNPNLPQQESGIKPANAIPYELYAHAASAPANKAITLKFTAGNKFFGDKAKGAGFIVYSGDKNWDFTVDAGDTIGYEWPLDTFPGGTYDLKVYSSNGFYRRYTGNTNDPEIEIALRYQAGKDGSKPNGNVLLHIRRLVKGNPIKIKIKDNSYKKPTINAVLNKSQEEIFIPIDLKSSHSWYDFTLTTDKNQVFSQQFAGHAEHAKESFTDPLMGNLY